MGIVIANIIAIYRRELQSYFVSPLAYGITSIFWLLAGLFFVMILLSPQGILVTVAAFDLQGQQYGIQVPPVDVPYEFMLAFFDRMGWLLLFILPILSMGLYTEERKRGTLELLATSPVTNWAVAIAKLLGVTTFFLTMILPLLGLEIFTLSKSNPPLSPIIPILAHGGLLLFATAILSLGMFISSLTDSAILAAILTFALIVLLVFIDLIGNSLPSFLGSAISHLSLLKHYNTLIQGIFDTSSLILFASYIILGIFLTAQSIDTLRFQRQ